MRGEIIVNQVKIIYELQYKKVKNINLRIKENGSIIVSANKKVPKSFVEEFIKSKSEFIIKHFEKIEKQKNWMENKKYFLGKGYFVKCEFAERNEVLIKDEEMIIRTNTAGNEEKVFESWLKEQGQKVFEKIMPYQLKKVQDYCKIPEIKIRKMKARWGSCAYLKDIVTLNMYLVCTPIECVEYVILHELVHFIYPNHSNDFYGLLEELMPDYKKRRKILSGFSLICRQ